MTEWESQFPPPIAELSGGEALEIAMNDPKWRAIQIRRSKESRYANVETCSEQLKHDCNGVRKETARRQKVRASWEARREAHNNDLSNRATKLIDNIVLGQIPLENALDRIIDFK